MSKVGPWSEDDINFFVHLYRSHQCLWNIKKASYSSTCLKEAAFADIAVRMLQAKDIGGLGPEEIKEKMNNLRSSYQQLRKKYSFTSTCPSTRVGQWYKDMDFIVKCSKMHKRKETSNLDSKLFTTPKNAKITMNEPETDASSSGALLGSTNLLLEESYKIINNKTVPESSIKLKSRIAVMNVLKKLYMEKVSPNYNIVYHILKKIKLCNDDYFTTDVDIFQLEMIKLGYILKETIDGKKILIENAEQRFERYIYLNKIRKLRTMQTKPIVYIDERVINIDLKYERFNIDNGLPSDSSLFFLAITKDGLLNGLFSNQATEETFNKWIIDILLSLLEKPSVIIMDKSPIHGAVVDTCPITRYSTKNEMLKWLIANNIPCSPNLLRPELFELIRKNVKETKEYKIDRIVKSHGHEVLRLPNSFPELNMADVLWSAISEGNSTMLMSKSVALTSLQVLQNTIVDIMMPSIDRRRWHEFERILMLKENEVYQTDLAIENILENYVFM